MRQEEEEREKSKLQLEEAEKQLDRYTNECNERLADALAHEAVHTALEKVAHVVGHRVLRAVPYLGWTLVGLDVVAKAQLANTAFGGCYEEEIGNWKTKVKKADEEYKYLADRDEIGKKISLAWREEIRVKLIDKEIELKKVRGNRKAAESDYRDLYDKVYGDKCWTQDNQFSDKTLENLKLRNNKKVIDLLNDKIK